MDDSGLGTYLSASGLTRYVSRLERFQSFLDSCMETPVSDLFECELLPLGDSFCFSERQSEHHYQDQLDYMDDQRERRAVI